VNGTGGQKTRYRVSIRVYILLALGVLSLGGALLYTRLEDMSFFEALYMVIITITTVGYGDVHPSTMLGRAITLVLVPAGLFLVFGLGFSLVQEQLNDLILRGGGGRMAKKIANLQGHYIVCGYGRLGRSCVDMLQRLGCTVVVVERNREAVRDLADSETHYVVGDALEEETLRRAGIERAKSVVATFSNDTFNVYLTLEARGVRTDIEVVSAAGSREASHRLYLAGASRVISPQILGAELLAKSAVNPSVFQLMSDMISSSTPGENISQFPISGSSPLVGKQLIDLKDMGIGVRIMLVHQGGEMHLSPSGQFRIAEGSVLVAVGDSDELEKMQKLASGR